MVGYCLFISWWVYWTRRAVGQSVLCTFRKKVLGVFYAIHVSHVHWKCYCTFHNSKEIRDRRKWMLALMHRDKITKSHEMTWSTKIHTRIKVKCKFQSPAASTYRHLSNEENFQCEWERRVHNCVHKSYYFSILIQMDCVHFLNFFMLNTNFKVSDKFLPLSHVHYVEY